jgi:hypothetical protein
METPIEIKLFVQKREQQPQDNVVMHDVYWMDSEWKKYEIDSVLMGNWDARRTIALKRKK